jgi:hypothetical protein
VRSHSKPDPHEEEEMKVKTYLKASVMPWRIPRLLREEQEELARFGEIPAPGKATLTLPMGTVKATYKESKKSGGDDTEIYFGWSQSLKVTVRPAGGGEPLELKRGYGQEVSTWGGKEPLSAARIGKIEVPVAGSYEVTVEMQLDGDEVEPRVSFGA